jgi:glycosyltransferase involved in cell wall biosynthesis
VDKEIFRSPLLLRYLVRNPNITVKVLMSPRKLKQEYLHCDCQVLPSLEDGFAVAVADGMALGKPAIVSTETGIADTLTHLENGYLVPTGSAR